MSAPSDGARADARKRLAESTCAEHGDALITEAGGADMPTLYGRTYCPTCQVRFNEVMDSLPTTTVFPPESELGLLIFEDATPGGTTKIIERILASEWLAGVIADAKAEAWDERDRARATYPDPHPEDCAGWEDCWCASYPNPYRSGSGAGRGAK